MVIAIADKHGHSLHGHQLIERWYVFDLCYRWTNLKASYQTEEVTWKDSEW